MDRPFNQTTSLVIKKGVKKINSNLPRMHPISVQSNSKWNLLTGFFISWTYFSQLQSCFVTVKGSFWGSKNPLNLRKTQIFFFFLYTIILSPAPIAQDRRVAVKLFKRSKFQDVLQTYWVFALVFVFWGWPAYVVCFCPQLTVEQCSHWKRWRARWRGWSWAQTRRCESCHLHRREMERHSWPSI